MKEYIAYRGQVFQIEWYYTAKGKSQALEYAEKLSRSERVKFENLLRLMSDIGKIRDKAKFRSEGDQILAFKPFHGGHNRTGFYAFSLKVEKSLSLTGLSKNRTSYPRGKRNGLCGI